MRRVSPLFTAMALSALGAGCSGADDKNGQDINPEVESVIIVGTSVTKQIYVDGSYGLTLLPKDAAGKVLLGQGLKVSIEIATPSGFTSFVDETACSKPEADAALSVGVIIDDSGSMATNDAELKRKDAVVSFLSTLASDTEVLLTDYGPSGSNLRDLVCASQSPLETCSPATGGGFSTDMDALLGAVDEISASGGTPLYQSCIEMVKLVSARDGRKQAILLLSDGEPGDQALKTKCHADARDAGIPIFTVGLGPAAESDAMQTGAVKVLRELATESSAAYASADDPRELGQLFSSVGEALTQGKCDSSAILNEYEDLVVGARVRGTVQVGDKQAEGSFEFVAPAKN